MSVVLLNRTHCNREGGDDLNFQLSKKKISKFSFKQKLTKHHSYCILFKINCRLKNDIPP